MITSTAWYSEGNPHLTGRAIKTSPVWDDDHELVYQITQPFHPYMNWFHIITVVGHAVRSGYRYLAVWRSYHEGKRHPILKGKDWLRTSGGGYVHATRSKDVADKMTEYGYVVIDLGPISHLTFEDTLLVEVL